MRYKRVKIGGKLYLLHRYIMECSIGRPLTAEEYVHHVNNDPLDNRLENLRIVSMAEHVAEHGKAMQPVERDCNVCGATYRPHKTKRARSKTCSRACFSLLMRSQVKSPAARQAMSTAAFANGSAERAKTLVLHRWRK